MNQETSQRGSISLPGILLCIGGGGLLLVYFKFPNLTRNLTGFGRFLVQATAGGLIVAGVYQIVIGAFPRWERRREYDQEITWRPRISWLGLLLMLFGFELVQLGQRFEGPAGVFMMAVAALLMLFGFVEIGRRLLHHPGNRSARHRVSLPRQGIAFLVMITVLFVGSLLGRSNMLLLVFSMMAAPFVLNGWIIFMMLRKTQVRRSSPQSAFAGETVQVELTVTNRKRWFACHLLNVSDRVANRRERLTPGVVITFVPAGDSRSGRYHIRLMQRGRYRFGPMYVSTRYPFGLVERGLIFEDSDEILVAPRIGQLTSAWKREHGIANELARQSATRRGVFEDEFHHIREYHAGDNPRAIHWRTSARQNELMVREFQETRNLNLILLLDLQTPASPTTYDHDVVELAISFAATVCHEHMRNCRESSVNVLAAGRKLSRWQGQAGPLGMESLMDWMAELEPGRDPNLTAATRDAAAERTAGTRSIFVSTRPREDGRIAVFDELSTGTEFGRDLRLFSAHPDEVAAWFSFDG